MPVIKAWTQEGRVAKMGETENILDVKSRQPLKAGPGIQTLLRASGNRDRDEKGLRDSLPATTVVFCGVGDCS